MAAAPAAPAAAAAAAAMRSRAGGVWVLVFWHESALGGREVEVCRCRSCM